MSAVAKPHPHTETVKRLAGTGRTNAEIAAATGMSHAAVIGLRFRLGIPAARQKAAAARLAPPRTAASKAPSQTLHALTDPGSADRYAPEVPMDSSAPRSAVPFAALRRGGCKWPFGEGDAMRFCAAPAAPSARGRPAIYCACHAARAFRTPGSGTAFDKGWAR